MQKVTVGKNRYTQMATITQGNAHIDRVVYMHGGEWGVKINGEFFTIDWLEKHGRNVNYWFL